MTDWAWLFKRCLVASFLVGMFWNDDPRETIGVYMVVLSLILAAGWVRDVRRAAR
jgi:hypothetical protein